jgi:hypothetical protein
MARDVVDPTFAQDPDATPVAQAFAVLGTRSHASLPGPPFLVRPA